MPKLKNIIALRFGRLVVLERRGSDRRGKALWLCLCDCDTTTIVQSRHLVSGHTGSCGCFRRDQITTHGQTGTRTYRAWTNMLGRCNNPKSKSFEHYGGRGRKVRYTSLEAFVANMGECPPGHDIHRLDNDGDYEPGNCVWLPHLEHMRLHARRRKASSPRLLDGPSQV
jgi:hypothetical protein